MVVPRVLGRLLRRDPAFDKTTLFYHFEFVEGDRTGHVGIGL